MMGAGERREVVAPRRAEVLAGLSVAIDLGLGQPSEHMLRSAIIACRVADRLGLEAADREAVYYSTLLMWIGCHADSQEYARWFGDDIAVRHDAYLVDWSGLPYLRFLVQNVRRGEPLPDRLKVLAALFRDARGQLATMIHSHCASAALLARHMGLSPSVEHALAFTFERFDGDGLPTGASGTSIPMPMRVAQVSDVAEVHYRTYGVDGAVEMLRRRRGGQFDPEVVDAVLAAPGELLAALSGRDGWTTAIAIAPDRTAVTDDAELDVLLSAVGDFVDLKCPFTLGHSRSVAALACSSGQLIGLGPRELRTVRRAGHLHDVGRLGVSNHVWSTPAALTASEWERVRMHPYLTERALHRIPGLDDVRAVARAHHERIDGTGYPLGLGGASLGRPERLLAAAVAYQSAVEPRPYREAMTAPMAARRLRTRCDAGSLDRDCAEAVIAAATGNLLRHEPHSEVLTPREREVLELVARGLSNRDIAERLFLSVKTVRNHVERCYSKIGVSNRVGASLYALDHGLVSSTPAS